MVFRLLAVYLESEFVMKKMFVFNYKLNVHSDSFFFVFLQGVSKEQAASEKWFLLTGGMREESRRLWP